MALRPARSVRIDQDATGAIITLGDHSPVVVTRASGRVFALTPLTERPPVPPGAGPALLVTARHEVVPYVGRAEQRQQAADWLATDQVRAVRLLTAPGGQGKTRFAIRVACDAAAAGWQVLIARHELDGGLLPVDADAVPAPVPAEPAGALVVVDYADRWTLGDLLELLTRPEASGAKLRVLLLGRSNAFWSTLALTLRRAGVGVSECVLPELAEDGTSREVMFAAAVDAFAAEAGGPVDPAKVERPDLAADDFKLTLAVQIAALVAVLRARERAGGARPEADPEVLTDPGAVSRELLVREVDHWQKLRQRMPDPVTVTTPVMARAVLVATLTRGLPAGEAVDVLGQLSMGADPRTVVDEHAQCYPVTSQSHVLEPLYPDRLGEDFVAAILPGAPPGPPDGLSLASLADPAATTIVERLLRSDRTTSVRTPALTILVEIARRWDHVAATLLTRLRETPGLIVGCGGTVIARVATIPTLAPILPGLGTLLDDTIGAGTHLTLDPGAVVVQQQLVAHARGGGDRARLAGLLATLAVRLAAVGRRPQALHAAQEAVDLYRELVGLNRDAYLPGFAMSVNRLAIRLVEAGRRPQALEAAQEAVTLRRELVGLNRDAYLPDLANSVSNLAVFLAEVGRRPEALDAAQEAADLYRELVGLNRDANLPGLAMSVGNLAVHLAGVGRRAEALDATQEAVTLRRELVGLNRDAYLPDLAVSVNNLAVDLAGVGRRAEALDAAQEAVTLRRELVGLNRDAYLPGLAMSVNNLADYLAKAGRRAEALDAAQEAVTLRRELVGLNRDAYLPNLAESVNTLANRLAENGRRQQAQDAAQEAADLYRELDER